MIRVAAHIVISEATPGGCLTSDLSRDTLANWPGTRGSLLDRIQSSGSSALEAAAALAVFGLEAEEGLGPPLINEKTRHPEFRQFLEESAWAEALPSVQRKQSLVLAAGLLQIYDYWDESHDAAQKAGDLGEKPYSACWHAICHRREPDPGNAGYWLAKARGNPVGQRLAGMIEAGIENLDPAGQSIATRLIRGGEFQDRTMVELCCRPRPPEPERRLLRQIQKLEMILLLGATLDELS